MKIGELAGRAGLKPSAIRYYEKMGILDAPHRVGGQRHYSSDALDRVLNHGTHYYTLTYAPPDKNMDGRLRHIQVKVSGGSYHLSYRRGYYARDESFVQAAKSSPTRDKHSRGRARPLRDHWSTLRTRAV